MSAKSRELGKFLLTASLLVVIAQGLWLLPALQDHLYPDNYWEIKLQAVNNEDWHIRDGLTSLKLRIAYLEWCLMHKGSHKGLTMDWLLQFPVSESIRSVAPKFAWNINVYLASKYQVKVQRKLKNLDALVKNIPQSKKQEFIRKYNNILLIDKYFEQKFISYNDKLNKLKNQLAKLNKICY
jgi:hypothetical protein